MSALARKVRPDRLQHEPDPSRAPLTGPGHARPEVACRKRKRLAPLARTGRVSTLLTRRPQPATRISSPNDPAEREAEKVARQIVRMPTPLLRGSGTSTAAGGANDAAAKAEQDRPARASTAIETATPIRGENEAGPEPLGPPVGLAPGRGPSRPGLIARTAQSSRIDRAPRVSAAGPTRAGLNSSSILRHASRSGPLLTAAAAPTRPAANHRTLAPGLEAEIGQATATGNALPSGLREEMEPRFGADFSPVRMHDDERAQRLSARLGARAFTFGRHVFFGRGEYRPEREDGAELVAHELTHTIQQGAVVQRSLTTAIDGQPMVRTNGLASGGAPEVEADAGARTLSQSSQLPVIGNRGASSIQREDADAPWWRRAGRAVGGAISSAVEFGESIGWQMLEEFAPELVPVIRQGPVEWIKEKITNAVETVFDTLMAPVRPLTGIASALTAHFGNLVSWVRQAAARIAGGDCGAISEAAEKIQEVFEGLASPIIDRIKQLAGRVKDFFSGLWDRFGAPVWQFLQRIGGAAWEQIQRLGRWIWEKTAPMRRLLDRAWTWVKNKLGIGEGAEGQDGILQWVQRKAQSVWDEYIKPFYERYRREILIVAAVLVMLSPAGPYIAIAAAIGGLAAGIRWIRQHMRNRQAIVQQRGILQGVIIPGIFGAVNRVSAFLLEKAGLIADKLRQVVGGLNQALGAVAGTILGFAVSVLHWIIDRFQELVDWAVQGLMSLANGVATTLERLRVFLQPILDVLTEIASVVGDIMRLPMLLAGRVWNAIPACIRDPFVDFFIPLILRQIAFFRELAASPEAWRQTRAQVMELIHQVFHSFDLLGAIRSAFRLVVRALHIPVELMGQLLDKAASAWDAVLAAPLQFIENALKAILLGIGRFMGNILSHLWAGVQGWLFNAVSQSGSGVSVAPPSSWTDPRAVFGFVLGVLGISLDHVIQLIERRLPGVGRTLRTGRRYLTGALEWLGIAIDQGPRGLWQHIVDRLRNLGTLVLESAVGWIMTRVIAIVGARLAALAASAGLSAVLEAVKAVYNAIQTAIEFMPRILAILIRVFNVVNQIAASVIGPAAALVEGGLRMAMPIVIGFLANYAGLGGIGGRIAEIIRRVRQRIDNAILSLIDRGIGAIRRVVDRIRRGARQAGSLVAEQGRAGDQRAASPSGQTDRTVTLARERHTIRALVRNNRLDVLMSSNGFQAVEDEIAHVRRHFVDTYLPRINRADAAQMLGTDLDSIATEKVQWVNRYNTASDTLKEQVLQTGLNHFVLRFQAVNQKLETLIGPWALVRVGDTIRYVMGGPPEYAIVTEIMVRAGSDFGLKARPVSENPRGRKVTKKLRDSGQSVDIVLAPSLRVLLYRNYGSGPHPKWEKFTGTVPMMPGAQDNPFLIDWPKPAWDAYPTLYFGGPRPQTTQTTLRAMAASDPTIQAYPPSGGTLGSHSIGIQPPYRLTVDSVIGPLSTDTTPGGKLLLDILRPYGFNPDADGMQADHVHDTQFGGGNVIENLWPLQRSINSAAGSALRGATATVPGSGSTVKVRDLKRVSGTNFWFKIKSTR